jgi:SET domain-containing protein
MRNYADEGIKHFYFMMLQKDEFIDATKKGDIGRFANHSCNPNCYVAKWVVDNRLRMGIFAKRDIKKDEELTFNYNVDRYGNDAQVCYCGEPNCVGFIGGKTQTDLGGMDELYMDALGITDEIELLNLKGTKKRKGRSLDEDYMVSLYARTPL